MDGRPPATFALERPPLAAFRSSSAVPPSLVLSSVPPPTPPAVLARRGLMPLTLILRWPRPTKTIVCVRDPSVHPVCRPLPFPQFEAHPCRPPPAAPTGRSAATNHGMPQMKTRAELGAARGTHGTATTKTRRLEGRLCCQRHQRAVPRERRARRAPPPLDSPQAHRHPRPAATPHDTRTQLGGAGRTKSR